MPLPLLGDSPGIKGRGEGEWPARRRAWRKVHPALDASRLEVRAVEITGGGGGAPVRPDRLGQIPEGEAIASVAADGAHDARGCRDAIANRGAGAAIPPRRNATPWRKASPGAAGRNEALRVIKRLGPYDPAPTERRAPPKPRGGHEQDQKAIRGSVVPTMG